MARLNTPIGGFNQLWQSHERLYLDIFIDALTLLDVTDEQRKDEDAISEALCPVLREVCFSHPKKPLSPQWERPIAPTSNDELKGGKTRKRPDFTCSLVNTFAQSSDTHEISLHIECKRLGAKVGSYDLNQNYVKKGAGRFDYSTHEYGKLSPSGLMIGYIITPYKPIILNDVNKHMASLNMPSLNFKFSDKVESCVSILNRTVVEPKAFKLIHIWADLNTY